jgi:hypothetical protein
LLALASAYAALVFQPVKYLIRIQRNNGQCQRHDQDVDECCVEGDIDSKNHGPTRIANTTFTIVSGRKAFAFGLSDLRQRWETRSWRGPFPSVGSAAPKKWRALEIGMTDRPVDLIREAYDLALRAGRLADSDLAVRTLGELPMALVASPKHLERNGRPGSLEDLSRAAHVRYMLGGRPFPIRFVDGPAVSPEGRLDLDSGSALRVAALRTPPLRARLFMDFVAAEIAAYLE